MKFTVKTSDFQKAISTVEGVISAREIKSSLSNVKIEDENNLVSLSATDLEISIKTSIPSKTLEGGTISLPAKQLSQAFKAINFNETMIETFEDDSPKTKITDADKIKDFHLVINGFDGEENRTIPKVDSSSVVDFPCQIFASMFRKTSYCVAMEDTRFVFNGIFMICNEKKLSFVATDGRRLSKVERTVDHDLPFAKGIIVPHKAIKEINRMIDSNELGKIGVIDEQIYTHISHTELLCKLIDGHFPDYEAVIPKDYKRVIRMAKDDLQVAIKQAMIAAEEPSKQIRLRFTSGNLNINSSTPGSTEININIPIGYSDEEVAVAFKGEYLLDIFKSIDDSDVILEIKNSNSPVVFKDPSDPDFISVIMPMKF